jgi:hypothetical protein
MGEEGRGKGSEEKKVMIPRRRRWTLIVGRNGVQPFVPS